MQLRERLKTMELRITELADYLQVSRPTMYKFIDYYEKSEFDLINKKVLKLFNYIKENDLVGKKSVINYILTNLTEVKELGDSGELEIIKKIKKFIISNPESKKSQFLVLSASNDIYDDVIIYLVRIYSLLKKRNLTEEESQLIQPYLIFKKELKILGGNK